MYGKKYRENSIGKEVQYTSFQAGDSTGGGEGEEVVGMKNEE
jgi:hypothetical protein